MAGTYEAQSGLEEIMEEQAPAPEVYEEIEPSEDEVYTEKVTTMVEHKRAELGSTGKYALTLIIYLLALLLAELLTTYISKTWGLTFDTIILFVLLVNSALVTSDSFSNLLRCMMVVPIIRVVGLSIPILQIDPLYWFPIIAVPLFIAAIVIMRTQRLSMDRVGLVWGNIPIQLLIGVTGLFTGIVEYFILKPNPLIVQFTPLLVIGGGIILLISTGLAEELLFRGIIQNNASRVIGPGFALLYTSLVFATMHIGWLSPVDFVFVFSVGMFYGYCFMKTQSIFGVSVAHGFSNIILFLVMPFVNLAALSATLALHI
jgi:membrane protease YdiL (CAAX protease family)